MYYKLFLYKTCQPQLLLLYLRYFFSLFPFGNIRLAIPGDRSLDSTRNHYQTKGENMQIKTYFEKSLCESAGLFSLQKKQADLFLLSQTGLITYRQLALCNLHGKTETAGRLSLKTLEKDGLIQSRKLPNQHQNKYYFLTPKGRSILKSLFPPILLEYLQISLEKRLPAGGHPQRKRDRKHPDLLSCFSTQMLPHCKAFLLPVSCSPAFYENMVYL